MQEKVLKLDFNMKQYLIVLAFAVVCTFAQRINIGKMSWLFFFLYLILSILSRENGKATLYETFSISI